MAAFLKGVYLNRVTAREAVCPWREEMAGWTKQRGNSPRSYPGALVWAVKKPGRELREKVELWLAWKCVASEIAQGTLGGDFDSADRTEVKTKVSEAEVSARDAVWSDYRYVVLADKKEKDGLAIIDLGAGHASSGASSGESLCGRIITALKSSALLNEAVGAGYLERNWPPAFKESGAWPLAGLRQSFLDGALTRLVDPDTVLRTKIIEFVAKGEFGLASGHKPDGTYERVWFDGVVEPEEVSFESGVFLVLKDKARSLVVPQPPAPEPGLELDPEPDPEPLPGPEPGQSPALTPSKRTLRVHGELPPELWNRLGTKLLPKLRSGNELKVEIDLRAIVDEAVAGSLLVDLGQILEDLGIADKIEITNE